MCLALMFISVTSYGEETGSQTELATESAEIMFRNIPWGTTCAEFMTNYNEFGINVSDPYISQSLNLPSDESSKINVYSNGYSVPDGYGAGFEVSASDYSDGICTVAGYSVEKVAYNFIFSVDETTGYIDTDINNAKLFNGHYSFRGMSDATSMVEDLVAKISSLYGDVKDSAHDTYSGGDILHHYLWENEKGEWIVLTQKEIPDGPDVIFMNYFAGDIFEWTSEMTDACLKEEADSFSAPTGTDGL